MVSVMFIVEKLNFAQEFLQTFKYSLFKYSVVRFTISDVSKDVIAFICSAKLFQVEA